MALIYECEPWPVKNGRSHVNNAFNLQEVRQISAGIQAGEGTRYPLPDG